MTERPRLPTEATLLHARMTELFRRFGVDAIRSAESVNYVLSHYADPTRHYHNLDHLRDCMVGVDWVEKDIGPWMTAARFTEIQAIELALWYHDLVYDSKRRMNEEISAAIFCDHARELRLDAFVVEEVSAAILSTRHKAVPTSTVAKWVVDIDLNILRTPEPRFDDYERKIREEFDWVPDAQFIAGRTKVLQDLLDRDWIYSTPMFRRLYEGDARANLKRSLARLAKGEVIRLNP